MHACTKDLHIFYSLIFKRQPFCSHSAPLLACLSLFQLDLPPKGWSITKMATVKIKSMKAEQPKRAGFNPYLSHTASRHWGERKSMLVRPTPHSQSVMYTAQTQQQLKAVSKWGNARLVFIKMKNAQDRETQPFSSLLLLWRSPYFPQRIWSFLGSLALSFAAPVQSLMQRGSFRRCEKVVGRIRIRLRDFSLRSYT